MAISAKQRVIDEIGDMHSSFVRDAIESIGNGGSSSDSGSGVDSAKMDTLAQGLISAFGKQIVSGNLDEAIGTVCIVSEQAMLIIPRNTTPIDYSLYARTNTEDEWNLVYSGNAPLQTQEVI